MCSIAVAVNKYKQKKGRFMNGTHLCFLTKSSSFVQKKDETVHICCSYTALTMSRKM